MGISRKQKLRDEFLNLPNILTLLRIAVIPIVIYFLLEGTPWSSIYATILFSAAAITDVVDGYLARKWNLITITGKFLDPLADKLIVMAVLVVLVEMGRIPAWMVVLLLSREISITALRSIASSEGLIIDAGREGKIKTSFQLVGLVFLCMHYSYPFDFYFIQPVVRCSVIGFWLLFTSMVFSIFSAFGYLRAFYQFSPNQSNS
jgi:CDP-diacylglycerol--glycerol-3-phosphate 3-phosphatidyltransferase